MKLRRLFSLILVLAVALTVAACKKPGGEEETYTFRAYQLSRMYTMNPHQYEMVHEADELYWILDALYNFEFNEDNTAYALNPGMAAEDPTLISPDDQGNASAWTVKLRSDLKWWNGEPINADDFIYSWKMLIDPNLANYRAGVLWEDLAITGAEDYYKQGSYKGCEVEFEDGTKELNENIDEENCTADDLVTEDDEDTTDVDESANPEVARTVVDWPEVEWDDVVKITKINDYEIKMESDLDFSPFYIKYNLSSNILAPVYEEYYEMGMNADRSQTTYGTSLDSLMGHGAFKLVSWQKGKELKYEKNDLWYNKDEVNFTGITTTIYTDDNAARLAFEDGLLDYYTIPGANFDDYASNPFTMLTAPSTTWRIVMNSTERPDDETKPILLDKDFRQAVYHAFDRKNLTDTLARPGIPSQVFFSGSYIGDVNSGKSYRDYESAQNIVDDLYPETNGYNLTKATELYNAAVQRLKDAGQIENNKIQVEILSYTAETSIALNQWVSDQLEEAFNKSTNPDIADGNIEFDVIMSAVDNRYDMMQQGTFDMAWAGWSGMNLDPYGMYIVYVNPVYKSEYGYDASTHPVTYDGVDYTVEELWEELTTGDFQFADVETRVEILATLESTLIHSFEAAPLYHNAGAQVFSERVDLPVDEYVPIMGFGLLWASLTEADE